MPRKRRRRATPTAATKPTFMTTTGWRWRSFPVFFAFACGIFLMGWASVLPPVHGILFYVALFGVAFGAAHMATRWVAEKRMRRQAPSAEAQRDAGERHQLSEAPSRRR